MYRIRGTGVNEGTKVAAVGPIHDGVSRSITFCLLYFSRVRSTRRHRMERAKEAEVCRSFQSPAPFCSVSRQAVAPAAAIRSAEGHPSPGVPVRRGGGDAAVQLSAAGLARAVCGGAGAEAPTICSVRRPNERAEGPKTRKSIGTPNQRAASPRPRHLQGVCSPRGGRARKTQRFIRLPRSRGARHS